MHGNTLLRIVDANLNRAQEGLRVCEDIVRFVLNDKKLSVAFKSLRHRVAKMSRLAHGRRGVLLKSRNSKMDVGKKTSASESRRKNISDVFRANAQRVKESLRTLEEITKLFDRKMSGDFKKMRFRIYELEKKTALKLEIVLHNG
ncbi:MAG: thiamine-phosphate pyrophosphorylase [Candidatus Omnitrophica bacterium]|nr:thiamine-phosphate pyrophosphorylase [Candidatus Omnitrophota bacterium]